MSPARVVIAGCGGNIGSAVVPLIGRLPEVEAVTLIDPGVYEGRDLIGQTIEPAAVGRPKALVQTEVLRRLRPTLEVLAIADRLENVPRGLLRADVVLSCLDSRRSRAALCAATFRIGAALLDAGVLADGLLVRVTVFLPGGDRPCYGCTLDGESLDAASSVYPCRPESRSAPTGAPAGLGALAASLLALECAEFLAGRLDPLSAGRERLFDARHHQCLVSRLRRNPGCRFDHRTAPIERLSRGPAAMTLGDLSGLTPDAAPGRGRLLLEVEGRLFATRLACPACFSAGEALGLWERLDAALLACPRCGRARQAVGTCLDERLDLRLLGAGALDRPLAAFGLRPHDVLTLHTSLEGRHFELGEDEPVPAPENGSRKPGKDEEHGREI